MKAIHKFAVKQELAGPKDLFILRSTYRSLLRESHGIDKSPIARALLHADPTSFGTWDPIEYKWLEPNTATHSISDALYWNVNGGRGLYTPSIGQRVITPMLRHQFRTSIAQKPQQSSSKFLKQDVTKIVSELTKMTALLSMARRKGNEIDAEENTNTSNNNVKQQQPQHQSKDITNLLSGNLSCIQDLTIFDTLPTNRSFVFLVSHPHSTHYKPFSVILLVPYCIGDGKYEIYGLELNSPLKRGDSVEGVVTAHDMYKDVHPVFNKEGGGLLADQPMWVGGAIEPNAPDVLLHTHYYNNHNHNCLIQSEEILPKVYVTPHDEDHLDMLQDVIPQNGGGGGGIRMFLSCTTWRPARIQGEITNGQFIPVQITDEQVGRK
eukprot:PhF_6_TR5647/c0_g1_i2/m.8244